MNIISNGNNIYTVADLYKHLLHLAFKQTKISRYVRYIIFHIQDPHYLPESRKFLLKDLVDVPIIFYQYILS